MAPPDRTAIVADVKRELTERHVSLDGPCGAFAISRRVAWRLRDLGARLLLKPNGNNCEGFATDIVAFDDGSYVDCLIDAGGQNQPAWNEASDRLDLARLVRPSNPDPLSEPAPPTPVDPREPPPPPIVDPTDAERFVEALERIYDGLAGVAEAVQENTRVQKQIAERGVRFHL